MTQPLAFVIYEKLMPGSQLVNRLQDLGYRVQTVTDIPALIELAVRDKPLVVFADLQARKFNICQALQKLKQNQSTSHLPVIAFADPGDVQLQGAAREAGATLVVHENVLLSYLEQFLEQALQVE
jgi:CheY-like chemotaxis protein